MGRQGQPAGHCFEEGLLSSDSVSSQAFNITGETNTEGGFCLKALNVYLEREAREMRNS